MPNPPRGKDYRRVRKELLLKAQVAASAHPSVKLARFSNDAVLVRFKGGNDKVLRTAEDAHELLRELAHHRDAAPDHNEQPVDHSPEATGDLRDRMAAHSRHASWAVWRWPAAPTPGSWAWVKDLEPVRQADSWTLKGEIVVIGRNPATCGTVPVDWANFHDSANDGRLALALHDTAVRGRIYDRLGQRLEPIRVDERDRRAKEGPPACGLITSLGCMRS